MLGLTPGVGITSPNGAREREGRNGGRKGRVGEGDSKGEKAGEGVVVGAMKGNGEGVALLSVWVSLSQFLA